MTYLFWGVPNDVSPTWLTSKLHNQMIERASISDRKQCLNSNWPELDFPERPTLMEQPSATVNLEVSDEEFVLKHAHRRARGRSNREGSEH